MSHTPKTASNASRDGTFAAALSTLQVRSALSIALPLMGVAPLRGQDAGSTLVRLAERSTQVARARALHADRLGPTTRVEFAVQESLKGRLRGTFTLAEPTGRFCGSALRGVATGASYLAFLDADTRLTVRSARALIRVDPAVLAHVRALLAANPATRLDVLASGLSSAHDRIRTDAAIALPIRPGLEHMPGAARGKLVAALRTNLGEDDRLAFQLVRSVARLHLREAAPVLLENYVAGRLPAMQPMLLRVLPDLDAASIVTAIERRPPSGVAEQARVIALLERCPGYRATDCLKQLGNSRNRAIAALAADSLVRRTAAVAPFPKFRAIRPHRER